VASVVLAARSIGLSDARGQDCAIAAARGYREHLRDFSRMDPLRVWYSSVGPDDFIGRLPKPAQKTIRKRIEKAASGSGSELDFPKLAGAVGGQIRITEQPPLIFHPEVSREPEFQVTLQRVFQTYRKTLSDDRRTLFDRYRLIDAAIKVVGIGSVGRQMLDCPSDVRGKRSALLAIQGSSGIGA
jgi:Uncharacterized protein conserved in bacteria (DUF2252)